MSERDPVTYDFTDREALVMRQAFHKPGNVGQLTSGKENFAAIERMVQAGLLTAEPARNQKLLVRPTTKGREAWTNQGLRAAGRPLVRLT